MINQKTKNKDRVGCFGASDTKFIMSNWETKTFMDWWQTKVGTRQNDFKTLATITGTYLEHNIANHYAITHNEKIKTDRCVKLKKYALKVNLDCETKNRIIEIKTHKQTDKVWKVPKEYEWQVQVQMFATKKYNACIYAYALDDNDYQNYFLSIDNDRIDEIEIKYNKEWVEQEYLPRLIYFSNCLRNKKTPNKKNFEEIFKNEH